MLSGPAPTDLEVSVFGPGYGESVLIHVGAGRWLAIDSCVDSRTKQPRALDYLASLGINPATSVDFVLASHWHDDHVRGIARLLKACSSASFCCAHALTTKEFVQLAALYENDAIASARSSHELYACLVEAADRSERSSRPLFKSASSDKVLWTTSLQNNGIPSDVRLTALSPSDEMSRRALQDMSDAYSALKRGAPQDRPISPSPNHVATAVRLDVGGHSLLFGSDLEEQGDNLVGWSAVLNGTLSLERRSGLFKVAHHGSASGHLEDVWTHMLSAQPLCLLTPFRHGKHEIPTASDRARILAKTNQAFISSSPHLATRVATKRPKKIETLINAAAKARRQAVGPVGHIRWRSPIAHPEDPGSVDLLRAPSICPLSRS